MTKKQEPTAEPGPCGCERFQESLYGATFTHLPGCKNAPKPKEPTAELSPPPGCGCWDVECFEHDSRRCDRCLDIHRPDCPTRPGPALHAIASGPVAQVNAMNELRATIERLENMIVEGGIAELLDARRAILARREKEKGED